MVLLEKIRYLRKKYSWRTAREFPDDCNICTSHQSNINRYGTNFSDPTYKSDSEVKAKSMKTLGVDESTKAHNERQALLALWRDNEKVESFD